MPFDRYNYETENSKEIMRKIVAFLLGRPLHGATQKEIAEMLGLSKASVGRFVDHLVGHGKIHLSQPVRATQRGHLPAIYKHGPVLRPYFKPGVAYVDLPVGFFPKLPKPKSKKPKKGIK